MRSLRTGMLAMAMACALLAAPAAMAAPPDEVTVDASVGYHLDAAPMPLTIQTQHALKLELAGFDSFAAGPATLRNSTAQTLDLRLQAGHVRQTWRRSGDEPLPASVYLKPDPEPGRGV